MIVSCSRAAAFVGAGAGPGAGGGMGEVGNRGTGSAWYTIPRHSVGADAGGGHDEQQNQKQKPV